MVLTVLSRFPRDVLSIIDIIIHRSLVVSMWKEITAVLVWERRGDREAWFEKYTGFTAFNWRFLRVITASLYVYDPIYHHRFGMKHGLTRVNVAVPTSYYTIVSNI